MAAKFLLPVLACAMAFGVSACSADPADNAGESNATASSSATPLTATADPCGYVSKEDVAAATGEAVVGTQADGRTCSYRTEDEASTVRVEVLTAGGADEMQSARSAAGALGEIGADLKKSGGAQADAGEMLADSSAVAGLGDQSFYGPNQQLHVLKGDAYFAVSPPIMRSRMSSGDPVLSADQKREMAAAIARKIAMKM